MQEDFAQTLDSAHIIGPTGAGVGSAIGFLEAPVAFEVIRSRYLRLDSFEASAAENLIKEMRAEALAIVRQGAPDAATLEQRTAAMRYLGQGHEITVALPPPPYGPDTATTFRESFEEAYRRLFGRLIEDLEIEVLSWSLTVSTEPSPAKALPEVSEHPAPAAGKWREVHDPAAGRVPMAIYDRSALRPGVRLPGPALIVEDQTTTVVPVGFDLRVNGLGYLELFRHRAGD